MFYYFNTYLGECDQEAVLPYLLLLLNQHLYGLMTIIYSGGQYWIYQSFLLFFCWLLLPPWFNWWTWMQFIMFDNNCLWIFRKFPYFTYFTKTSWSQSTTTFVYIFMSDLPAIYLFVLHQMRTLRIMTLIGSTTSAQSPEKFDLLLSVIFDLCLPSFADSKPVDLFIGML